MRRISVIGTSCAGKSTFAARVADQLGVPHVELDSLHWEPGWIEVSVDSFRTRVAAATAGDAWVVDGNYSVVRDLLWSRLDTLIWLDYPFPLILWRALRRTVARILRRDPCCNGNRETLRRAFSRDSILLWVIRSHHAKRRKLKTALPLLAATGVEVVVLRTPKQAERWIKQATSIGLSASLSLG